MKKYLYLIMVAIFATMSVSLTSCGDDEDEPNGGSSSSKWQTVTINGQNFYNCLGGAFYLCSTYELEDGYIYENGHYEEMEMANFDIKLYDEKSIEAEGLANISFSIPASSFSNGRNITSDLIGVYVEVNSDDYWNYGEDNRDHKVISGTVKLANVKNGKATVKFDNFKVKLEGETITIDGEATCEVD